MAIIKQPGDENIGGVPVVSSGTSGGRAPPSGGGVYRPANSSGSGGGSGPGFVNINRMLSLNQGQGQKQADNITQGKADEGEAIKKTGSDLESGFNSALDTESKDAGVGVQGSKPTSSITTWNSTQKGPWTENDYKDNEKYANNVWNGPQNIRGSNSDMYDQNMTKADNLVKDVNSYSTAGGLQNQLQSKYGYNGNAYGNAFDEQLTRTNGQDQFQDLQNRYSGIYKTLSDANLASGAKADASRTAAGDAQKYNQAELGTKKASVDNDKRLEDSGYWDPSIYWTSLSPGPTGGYSIDRTPTTYAEYVAAQQTKGKPYMSETEFKRGQDMNGVNAVARSNPSAPNDKRKTGTIKQA
jgi:hypothetical protein